MAARLPSCASRYLPCACNWCQKTNSSRTFSSQMFVQGRRMELQGRQFRKRCLRKKKEAANPAGPHLLGWRKGGHQFLAERLAVPCPETTPPNEPVELAVFLVRRP